MSPPIVHQYFIKHILKKNRAANRSVRRGSCARVAFTCRSQRARTWAGLRNATFFALFSICPVSRHRNSGAIFSLVGIQKLYRDLRYLFTFSSLSFRFMNADLFMQFSGVLIQVMKRRLRVMNFRTRPRCLSLFFYEGFKSRRCSMFLSN